MKKTKNMYYEETIESNELTLFAVNDSDTYKYINSVINTLKKHVKRENYDREKAIIAFYHVADYSAKKYHDTFCSPKEKWNDLFNVTCRYTVAINLLKYFDEDIHDMIPVIL